MKRATIRQLLDLATAAPPPPPAATGVVAAWRAGQRIAGDWQPSPQKPGFYRITVGDTVHELETALRPAERGNGLVLAVRIWSQKVSGGPITTDVLEMVPVTDATARAEIARLAPRVRRQFGLPEDAVLFADTRQGAF